MLHNQLITEYFCGGELVRQEERCTRWLTVLRCSGCGTDFSYVPDSSWVYIVSPDRYNFRCIKARRAIANWLPLRLQRVTEGNFETPALLFSIGPRESLERLDVRTIHRIVRCTSVAKGFSPYHPHQLRHACATHMHDHGAPIQAVAAMLGHARLSTAQIYTRVSPVRMLDVYRRAHPHSTGA